MAGQSLWIDNLMNDAMESDLRGVPEEPNQWVIHITFIAGTLFILATVRCPAENLTLTNVVALNQVIAVGRALDCILYIREILGSNPFVRVKHEDPGFGGSR